MRFLVVGSDGSVRLDTKLDSETLSMVTACGVIQLKGASAHKPGEVVSKVLDVDSGDVVHYVESVSVVLPTDGSDSYVEARVS